MELESAACRSGTAWPPPPTARPGHRGRPAGLGTAGRAVVVGAAGPRRLDRGRARLAGADTGDVGPVLLAAPVPGAGARAGARGAGDPGSAAPGPDLRVRRGAGRRLRAGRLRGRLPPLCPLAGLAGPGRGGGDRPDQQRGQVRGRRRSRCWPPRSCSATRPAPGGPRRRPRWRRHTRPSAPASPANCTTWSLTSCRPSPSRRALPGSPAPAARTGRCWPPWNGWPGRR